MTNKLLNKSNLSRATMAGIGLAAVGIVAFIVLWSVFGQAGLDPLPRLLLSMCLPPTLLAGILGVYLLVARPASGQRTPPESNDHSS